ncbi:MAG TPA: hypothetical protein VKA70_06295 [Blastocatellia bacterium]|nr:hypothetical protein [Blastocatellia bacterium]
MTDEEIIAYLLEELPEEDLERFEDECFAQQSWPDQIGLVEEDLIDAYLRNELSAERRRRFETNYLTTEARQERVVMAAALLRHVDEHNAAPKDADAPEPTPTWAERFRAFWASPTFRVATSVAVVAFIAAVVWLLILPPPSPGTPVALTLSITNVNRAEGADASKIKLPPDAGALEVTLTLPQPSPQAARYRVVLEDNNGNSMPVEVKAADAQAVLAVIPADRLARGPYALKLFAVRADGSEQRVSGSYLFTVE